MDQNINSRKTPLTISDVIYEVQKLDLLEKGTKEYEKAHKFTVSIIKSANSLYGAGRTSLSKTRSLLQYMRNNESGVFLKTKKKKENKK